MFTELYLNNYVATHTGTYYFSVSVLAILKKNYTRLCQCLPQDYMKTINKIKQLLRLSDDVLSDLTNLPTADLINEKIIVLLMTVIQSDIDALQICDVMENLIDSKSSTIIELLRNGKFASTITHNSYVHH